MGKSTNFQNILNVYPPVILHLEHSVYQIVWLKSDKPLAKVQKLKITNYTFLEFRQIRARDWLQNLRGCLKSRKVYLHNPSPNLSPTGGEALKTLISLTPSLIGKGLGF